MEEEPSQLEEVIIVSAEEFAQIETDLCVITERDIGNALSLHSRGRKLSEHLLAFGPVAERPRKLLGLWYAIEPQWGYCDTRFRHPWSTPCKIGRYRTVIYAFFLAQLQKAVREGRALYPGADACDIAVSISANGEVRGVQIRYRGEALQ